MTRAKQNITYRKRVRARPRRGVWLAVLVVFVVLSIWGAATTLARSRALASVPAASSESATAASSTRRQLTPTQVQTETTAIGVAGSPGQTPKPADSTSPQSQTRQTDPDDPVAAAAVDFPDAPAVKPKSIDHLQPKHKYIAITLDDGYGYQPQMLKLLKRYDARCTVFLVGQWVVNNRKSVRSMKKAGFEIANHTWDHKALTSLSNPQIRSELLRTQTAISSVTGNQAPYMRPPGGAIDTRVKELAAGMGYKVIMWNRTFADSSRHPSPQKAYRSVMERGGGVRPGDIILCHWGSENSYEALKQILPELKARGYEFVTVSELIADSKRAKKSND